MSVLIRDVLVVPNDPEQPYAFWGWVAISEQRIQAVGSEAKAPPQTDQVLEGKGQALIPGLVNAHAHSHSCLGRGAAEDLPLEPWLEVIGREYKLLTPELAYVAAKANYCEALQSGTTTIIDMCLFPEEAARAAVEVGIRACIVPYCSDQRSHTPTVDRAAALLQDYNQGRVLAWTGLSSVESCSIEEISAGIQLTQSSGARFHIHCAETQRGVEQVQERMGTEPVKYLAQVGALGPKTLLAHCVWLEDEDQDILAQTGSHVAHCPHSNLKLASGIAPVPQLMQRGVNVGLGTDGVKSNNNMDMFEVMKLASILHKGIHRRADLLPARQILEMATSNGAKAAGVEAGRMSPGQLADMILIDLKGIHMQPAVPQTILANLVHSCRGSDVNTVIVEGQVVVKDKLPCSVDPNQLSQQVNALGQKLISQAYPRDLGGN